MLLGEIKIMKLTISLCIDPKTFEDLERARGLVARSRFVEYCIRRFLDGREK